MTKFEIERYLYKDFLRPLLFTMDAEKIHNMTTFLGELLEDVDWLLGSIYSYKNNKLKKSLLGVEFENPIGLAAGFDYDGHLAKTMKHIGFGFNTVGSVTAKAYSGNTPPRLIRLISSKSLLVNKGFKSDGAIAVAKRLDNKNLDGHTIGISIGSSNVPGVNTISKAIDDYLFSFDLFRKKTYVKYFELNISCPNIIIRESFNSLENVKKLVNAIKSLKIDQPIFLKIHNEIEFEKVDNLVKVCLENGINGFIFANLIGNRENPTFDKREIRRIKDFKGGFSGKPTFEGSNRLIRHARQKFGKDIVIIGCGGVFNYQDAIKKFKYGADLIQLVTGLVFEGPQIAGEINSHLAA